MNNENIRVLARVMLIGKSASVNAVELFSALFRAVVFGLCYLYIKNFVEYRQSILGNTVLVIGAITIVIALIMLECMRTVKDRWYGLVKAGHDCSFSDLIVSFGVDDLFFSLLSAFASCWASVLRFTVFFFVPAASAFLTLNFLKYGVSNLMFTALTVGNFVLFCCALVFWLVSLNCISLARSLCVGDIKRFASVLSILDRYAFRIFRFGTLLSVVNAGSRRLAKIMYADYGFCKVIK
ncbi:MAG: hypothetical protein J6B25_01120 [Clostridia bacterium]|nr:hypothetical protein [Clostridia bacterium]